MKAQAWIIRVTFCLVLIGSAIAVIRYPDMASEGGEVARSPLAVVKAKAQYLVHRLLGSENSKHSLVENPARGTSSAYLIYGTARLSSLDAGDSKMRTGLASRNRLNKAGGGARVEPLSEADDGSRGGRARLRQLAEGIAKHGADAAREASKVAHGLEDGESRDDRIDPDNTRFDDLADPASESAPPGDLDEGSAQPVGEEFGFHPFASMPDPFDMVRPDGDPDLFVEPVVVSGDDGEFSLGGYYGEELFLVAIPNSEGDITWILQPSREDADPIEIENPALLLNNLDTDVFEAAMCSSAGCSIPLYVANPMNTAVPDIYQPIGSLNAEFDVGASEPTLEISGRAFDALQSALFDGTHGIHEAYLLVDGVRYDVELREDGSFTTKVSVSLNEDKIHDVQLWARDAAHEDAIKVDADYISEYFQDLDKVESADPSAWAQWFSLAYGLSPADPIGLSEYVVGYPPLYHDEATAVAYPRLDENNYLVLDGTASANAIDHFWTIENINSGEVYEREGSIVQTEDLPPGIYRVGLDVPTMSHSELDQFHIVIPPRFDMEAQQHAGTVHSRWTSELEGDSYKWNLHVAGYLFDEIGAALHGYTAQDYEAVVNINGQHYPIKLNAAGQFNEKISIGQTVESEYDIHLQVRVGEGSYYTAASLHQESLYVFDPP